MFVAIRDLALRRARLHFRHDLQQAEEVASHVCSCLFLRTRRDGLPDDPAAFALGCLRNAIAEYYRRTETHILPVVLDTRSQHRQEALDLDCRSRRPRLPGSMRPFRETIKALLQARLSIKMAGRILGRHVTTVRRHERCIRRLYDRAPAMERLSLVHWADDAVGPAWHVPERIPREPWTRIVGGISAVRALPVRG